MKPVPKPRRLPAPTISIPDLKVPPIPPPRSTKAIIRLRPPLAERSVPVELGMNGSSGGDTGGEFSGNVRPDDECNFSSICNADEIDNDVIILMEDITQDIALEHPFKKISGSSGDCSGASNIIIGPDWVFPANPTEFKTDDLEEIERYGVITPPGKKTVDNVPKEARLSLMQKIGLSHPLWYLPLMDRDAAAYLLLNASPGTFIVRNCTVMGCMALSVRVSDGLSPIDHFVVEPTGNGQKVHLKHSPCSFFNLPELLEFYHYKSDELRVHLRLPKLIRDLKTRDAIAKLSLKPDEFWRTLTNFDQPDKNPLCKSTRNPFNEEGICYLGGIQFYVQKMPISGPYTLIYDDSCPCTEGYLSYEDKCKHLKQVPVPMTYGNGNFIAPSEAIYPNGQHPYGSVAYASARRQIVHRAPEPARNIPDRPESSQMYQPPEQQKKREQLSRNSRRSQSVRGPEKPKEAPTRKKSFLRSLFGKDQKTAQPLAELTAFTPHGSKMQKGYNSAFDIGDTKYDPVYRSKDYELTMRTFKPLPGELTNIGRPLPPQPISTPEKSERNAGNAVRLAKHNEGSPGPAPQMTETRQPMRPPAHVLDQTAKQHCMDELRRKRMQSPTQMLVPAAIPVVPKHPESPKPSPRTYLRDSKKDHRLSVPNLVDPYGHLGMANVMESAKALKEKLGRTCDGELGPINEGLVTPVVRRKLFPREPITPDAISIASSSDRSDYPILPPIRLPEEPSSRLYSPVIIRREKSEKESELIWRRSKNNSAPLVDLPTNGANPRAGIVFPERRSGNWSAVNSEFKTRQKGTKRSSQPQLFKSPSPQMAMLAGLSSQDQNITRQSEYAQLSDINIADIVHADHNNDDDAVSVAGTVFNEPWDSNIWENLLDLAHHGDQGNRRMRRTQVETVVEEDTDEGSPMKTNHATPIKTFDREGLHGDRVSPSEVENRRDIDYESKFSTIDSRVQNIPRHNATSPPPVSVLSLPRAVSRFSNLDWIGSLDDLPTSVPRMSPIMNRRDRCEYPESTSLIQQYVETLSRDESTIFGATLARFFECTEESGETDPSIIIRNSRQFITGLKNYLTKQGEGKLHMVIDEERSHLKANQILSVDVILEAILHRIVLKTMKPQLYSLMVHELTQCGSLEAMTKNLRLVRNFSPKELGFENPDKIVLPDKKVMEEVKVAVKKMQNHYSPTKKVENLLRAVGTILRLQKSTDENHDGAKVPASDDVVRWFIYLIAKTSLVTIEVEAWYMYELLPQQMLDQGDATYYLTALLCAIHILKNIEALKSLSEKCQDIMNNIDLRASSVFTGRTGDAFLKVAIPDVNLGCVKYASFPGIPQMTVAKLCRVIAHSQGITNSEDYGLYLILDGFETPMQPNDCPDVVRDNIRKTGKSFVLAYKRRDAKIAWPVQVLSGLALC